MQSKSANHHVVTLAIDQPVWGQAFGNWGAQVGLNNVSGYNTDTGGLAFDFDKGLTLQHSS
jgi:uncharacterized protein with beta-barrel porin domain